MVTLNIIGCGRVGQCLGRVLVQSGQARIKGLFSRTLNSAQQAATFLGQGHVVSRVEDLPPADFYFVTTSDDAIAQVALALAERVILPEGCVVVHCSGSLGSDILHPLRKWKALTASVHPLKTFADPARAAETFVGTPCGVEGDEEACQRLEKLLTSAKGAVFRLQSGGKMLYHAGTVMACNYLTALMNLATQCLEASGMPREKALELALPLARETLENISRFGPEKALTGPVARGDAGLVARQMCAVERSNPQAGAAYRALGIAAVDLTENRGGLSAETLKAMRHALTKTPTHHAIPPIHPKESL